MIDIGFVNLILIIADNASGSKKPSNPYLSTLGAPGSLRLSALIVSGSPHSSAPIQSSEPNNSIANFLADILENLFGDFIVHASPDLAVDLETFSTLDLFS